jgi:hypothetical protein
MKTKKDKLRDESTHAEYIRGRFAPPLAAYSIELPFDWEADRPIGFTVNLN